MHMLPEYPSFSINETPRESKILNVKPEVVQLIESGQKTVEIRRDDLKIQAGDSLLFRANGNTIEVSIKTIYTISSLDKIFENDLYKKWLGNIDEKQARDLATMWFSDKKENFELTVYEFEVVK